MPAFGDVGMERMETVGGKESENLFISPKG